jgi:hypothetical protein
MGFRLSCARTRAHLVALSCLLTALVGSACGSTATQSVTAPAGEKCSVALNAPSAAFEAGGASGTVGVDTTPECAWTATADAAWITNLSPAQGQGPGQVQFQVAQNPSTSTRQSTITINAQKATIRQDATVCQFTLALAGGPFAAAGGSGTIAVSAPAACAWTASTNAGWIAVSPATGTGGSTITLTVAQNTGAERSGTVTVGGSSVTILQSAAVGPTPTPTPSCSVAINPTSRSVTAAAATGLTVGVSAAAGCQWTATSSAVWVTITSGGSGTANGTVVFSVAGNAGAARTGTIAIADKTFTVNQASGCTYSILPTSQQFGGDGGIGGPIAVTTAPTCPWTATDNASWLQITSGAAGTGPGLVTFQVAPYSGGGSSRTGTITIVNQTFTVTQEKR